MQETVSGVTALNFIIPAVGADVVVTLDDTTGLVVGRIITVDLANYYVESILSSTLVNLTNIDGVPATLVLTGSVYSTPGVAISSTITMPEAINNVYYDASFDRILVAGISQTLYAINTALPTIDCSVFVGMDISYTNLGNSGCRLFLPTYNAPAFPAIPTDNAYHVIT
jgi:hypothetical protein